MQGMTPLALLALASLVLAGCSDPKGEEPDGPAAFDDAPDLGSGKGYLRGLVLTPALQPVKGATVEHVATGASLTTDEDGAFVFPDLEPGTHFIQASKPGWTSVQHSADVVAGVEEPPIVKVLLERIPGTEPRAVTMQQEGFLACSIGTPVSYESCDATGADRPEVWFDIEGTPDWIQTEITWESTQPSGDWLYVIQGLCSCDGDIPDVGGARFNETAEALSPHIARADPDFLEDSDVGSDEAKQLLVSVSASGPEPDTTNGSGIAVSQPFIVYATFFYNLDPVPEWSFVANGPYPVPTEG